MIEERLSAGILGSAIEVHKALGPGLLESAYEECLCHELGLRGIPYSRQVDLPVVYKGVHLSCGYRVDIVAGEESSDPIPTLRVLRASVVHPLRFSSRLCGFHPTRTTAGSWPAAARWTPD